MFFSWTAKSPASWRGFLFGSRDGAGFVVARASKAGPGHPALTISAKSQMTIRLINDENARAFARASSVR